mgnify:CR=1 FL=1
MEKIAWVPPACQAWINKYEANALYEAIENVPAETLLGKWRDRCLAREIAKMADKEDRYLPLTDAF